MGGRANRAIWIAGQTVLAGVVATLTLSVGVANGSSSTSFCKVQVFSGRGAIDAAGVHISTVNVDNCRVAIEAVRLTFPRPVHGEPYEVQRPNSPPSAFVQPRGSGSRVLTLRLPSPLLATTDNSCSTEAGLSEFVKPLVPVGSRVTVTLISTQGVSETVVVQPTPTPPACLFR